MGYLARYDSPLLDHPSGIAISTFGKVIKRGWDWLGVSPAASNRVQGLIEVPDLAECLTLNKNDLVRSGARGAKYLAYRKAIQEVVSRQLAEWGDGAEQSDAPPHAARLDRDLEQVLEDLADDFPLPHSLVERRAGGQKRLPVSGQGPLEALRPLISLVQAADSVTERHPTDSETGETGSNRPGEPREGEPPTAHEAGAGPTSAHEASALPDAGARRRRARYGLTIRFERRPEDDELGRLMESTVWVNSAHPAFLRAESSRSLGYHLALSVALALAPLAVAPQQEHGFVTRFLAEWGALQDEHPSPRRRHARRQHGRRS